MSSGRASNVPATTEDKRAAIEEVNKVRTLAGKPDVLLAKQKTHAGRPAGIGDCRCELLDNDRGQSFGRFVKQQQLGRGSERASDRQHLLLPAAQCTASLTRKQNEHRKPFEGFAQERGRWLAAQTTNCDLDVFKSRQVRKNSPILGNQADAGTDAVGRVQTAHVLAVPLDQTDNHRFGIQHAFEQRAFARPVATKNRDPGLLRHFQGYAVQDVTLTIKRVNSVELKQG